MEEIKNINAGIRILIVEDEFINYSFLAKILKKEGFESDWAKNGKESLELVKNNTYALLLMDLKMPLLNGYEATKQLKADYPGIKIIAQTAYSHHEERMKALEAGCDDVVIKPIDREQILKLITNMLIPK